MYSLRIDQIYDEIIYNETEIDSEITMMEVFDNFTEHFECQKFIFAFEDKDKTGQFPRKPHYHAVFRTVSKPDTMRRWLKKHGFHKELASIHLIKNEEEMEKATLYILKQQQPVFTDFEENQLKALLSASSQYNFELDRSKNIAVEVLENVIKKISSITIGTSHEPTRFMIAETIYDEYANINAAATDWQKHYCFPVGQQLLRMIHYVESKLLLNSRERWILDNLYVINPNGVREEKRMQKRTAYADLLYDE